MVIDITMEEDQSTNLWITYSEINQIPVGLLSSKDIATPNFIILIGKILNILTIYC